MFLSGYVFAVVIGVAVGFVFSNIILVGSRPQVKRERNEEENCTNIACISAFVCYVNGRRFRISRKGRSYNWARKQLARNRLGTDKNMEERRIALPFVKPASLIISTISKPDFFNGSLANNFVAKSLASLFISPLCRKFTLHTLIHTFPLEKELPHFVLGSLGQKCELRDVIATLESHLLSPYYPTKEQAVGPFFQHQSFL